MRYMNIDHIRNVYDMTSKIDKMPVVSCLGECMQKTMIGLQPENKSHRSLLDKYVFNDFPHVKKKMCVHYPQLYILM